MLRERKHQIEFMKMTSDDQNKYAAEGSVGENSAYHSSQQEGGSGSDRANKSGNFVMSSL